MTLVSYKAAEPRPNKGFTMSIIEERVKRIFELASGFADAVDAFDELSDELFETDFFVFFSFAADFGENFPPENWYVSIENVIEQAVRIFDVTEEVKRLD